VIDLRSDTVTQPTAGMRVAIAQAEVGDEQKREDPTVSALQERVATLLGHEAALFVPTATMANQIALKLHGRPGDVLLAEETSHVLVYEYGGPAAHAGLVMRGLSGDAGRVSSEQVRLAAARSSKVADQRAAVLSLEDTHNNAGGRVWPLEELGEVVSTAHELGLAVHLDGARLLNACAARGAPPAAAASQFDSVTLCLSKGLGCPLGALLAGSNDLVERAWREKHLFGGAMRQAGIVAAAGLYALDHHVERLGEDNARALRLAEGLEEAGVPVDLGRVESNFVQIDASSAGLTRTEALERMHDGGVALSGTIRADVMRAVTHLEITDDDVEVAIGVLAGVLTGAATARRA
jgi:threonine aldolase